jgi:hypothetical protein
MIGGRILDKGHKAASSNNSVDKKRATFCNVIYDMIYLLTVIGLTTGSGSTTHIYTQTKHRKTQ